MFICLQFDKTALRFEAKAGNEAIAKVLFAKKANVDAQDKVLVPWS